MARELTYTATVTDGKLKIFGRKGFDEDIKDFEGEKVSIKIKKYVKSRSNQQNKFYFGNFMQSQIDCFKEFWGETYDKEQMHHWNKSMFWADEVVNEDTGEVFKKPSSSTSQSTIQWEEKLEKCRQWFRIKFSWELPFPEKQSEIEF